MIENSKETVTAIQRIIVNSTSKIKVEQSYQSKSIDTEIILGKNTDTGDVDGCMFTKGRQ